MTVYTLLRNLTFLGQLLFIASFGLVQAEIPPEQSKMLYKIFEKGKKHLSPLNGLALIHGKKIVNDFLIHDPQDIQHRILSDFFHFGPDKELLSTSMVKNPASHIGPETVARILDLAEKKALSSDSLGQLIQSSTEYRRSLEEGEKKLMDEEKAYADFLAKYQQGQEAKARAEIYEKEKMTPEKRKISDLKKKIKSLRPNQEDYQSMKGQLEEDLEKSEALLKQMTTEREEMVKNAISNKTAKDQEKRIGHIRNIFDTKSDEFRNRQTELINNLVVAFNGDESVRDEIRDYLLAYVWNKGTEKSYLKSYLDVMKEKGHLKNKYYHSKDKDSILSSRYSQQEMVESYRKISFNVLGWDMGQGKRWALSHPEMMLALNILHPKAKATPPHIRFQLLTRYNKGLPYPNCGENSLRNVLNILFFDPDRAKIDIELINELSLNPRYKLSKQLVDFYKKHQDPHLSQETSIHNEWNGVVSDQNEADVAAEKAVRYLYGQDVKSYGTCQIKPSYRNMRNLIERLIGVDDLNLLVADINKMRGRNIQYDDSGLQPKGNYGSVYIRENGAKYEWNFQIGHFAFSKSGDNNVERSVEDLLQDNARKFLPEMISSSGDVRGKWTGTFHPQLLFDKNKTRDKSKSSSVSVHLQQRKAVLNLDNEKMDELLLNFSLPYARSEVGIQRNLRLLQRKFPNQALPKEIEELIIKKDLLEYRHLLSPVPEAECHPVGPENIVGNGLLDNLEDINVELRK